MQKPTVFRKIDLLTKRILRNKTALAKVANFNRWFGGAVWGLVLAKQDEYFTKGDFVFEPNMMMKRG
ncbi:MAG: hypothetical protein PHE73_03470 [Sulfurovaceae bacterium]|nr:hypothetical protein [Sulfurovaceae bacterium]